jgi:hypothetical protein
VKAFLVAGIVVTAFGVLQTVAAGVGVPSSVYPLVSNISNRQFGERLGRGPFVASTTTHVSSGATDLGSARNLADDKANCYVQVTRRRLMDFAPDASRANVIGMVRQTECNELANPVGLAPNAVSSSANLVSRVDAVAAATDRYKLAVIAACIHAAKSYFWLMPLFLASAVIRWMAWITFQRFKRHPNMLGTIGALLGWGGFWTACLGGGCSLFLNGSYTIQLVSWGGFASIVGVYITLTWAKLWELKRLGAIPVQSVHVSADLSQPQPDSAPHFFDRELLVVERWMRVINEIKEDPYESCESGKVGEPSCYSEQISRSDREVDSEGPKLRS